MSREMGLSLKTEIVGLDNDPALGIAAFSPTASVGDGTVIDTQSSQPRYKTQFTPHIRMIDIPYDRVSRGSVG